MNSIVPADALICEAGGYPSRCYRNGEWFMAYEWFCRRLLDWDTEGNQKQLLNATSSINNYCFSPLGSVASSVKRLGYLFGRINGGENTRDFLAFCGIQNWADLARPIVIRGRIPQIQKESYLHRGIFSLCGSTLRSQPNSCHPEATTVHYGRLGFCSLGKRWYYDLVYGYENDSSSWHFGIKQRRESFHGFVERIHRFVDEQLEPENSKRQSRNRTWQRASSAVRDLFSVDDTALEVNKQIADLAVKIEGFSLSEGRAKLNRSRFETLKRWFQSERTEF